MEMKWQTGSLTDGKAKRSTLTLISLQETMGSNFNIVNRDASWKVWEVQCLSKV